MSKEQSNSLILADPPLYNSLRNSPKKQTNIQRDGQQKNQLKNIQNSQNSNIPSIPRVLSNSNYKFHLGKNINNLLLKSSPLKLSRNKQIKNTSVNYHLNNKIQGDNINKEKILQKTDSISQFNYSQKTDDMFYSNRPQTFLNQPTSQQTCVNSNHYDDIQIKNFQFKSIQLQKNFGQEQHKRPKSKMIKKQMTSTKSVDSLVNGSDSIQSQNLKYQPVRFIKENFNKKVNNKSYKPLYQNYTLSTNPTQNKFYQYCTMQLVKLSKQNKQIKSQMTYKQKQYKKLQQLNKKIQLKIQDCQKQNQIQQKQLQVLKNQKQILQKKLFNIQLLTQQKYPQEYKTQYIRKFQQHKRTINHMKLSIQQKQKDIQLLLQEMQKIRNLQTQAHIIQLDNNKIKENILKLKVSSKLNQQRTYKTNYVVDHLNQIKRLQLQNLVTILQTN